MQLRNALIALGGLVLTAGSAAAQATGTASFNAPYRAFEKFEFGGTLSFNEGDVTGIEGQIRFGYKAFDIGARGGMLLTNGDDSAILGVEGRGRVLTHTEQFPVDGAIVAGFGLTTSGPNFNLPVGLSLGRRVDFENSSVSIVPYGQPTLFMVFDGNDANDTINFGLGLGVDVRFGRAFDIRASFGIGDVDGFAVSAVWVK